MVVNREETVLIVDHGGVVDGASAHFVNKNHFIF
jgi:hypothetical protein